jgi:type II secretory pathway pseudopilin PulG
MHDSTIRGEAGFSIAETLVTIAIVGITFAAILGGLMTSIKVSALQRTEATADTVARSAAEWVKDSVHNPYVNCGGVGAYSLAGLSKPSGYNVVISTVGYWDGVAPTAGATYPLSSHMQTSCPGGVDRGLQRITIVASSADGQATETVQVLKRTVS